MLTGKLIIDGYQVPLMDDCSIRFYHPEGGPAEAVLYRKGRRVTKAWMLYLKADVPEDPYGGNANTES